MKPCLPLIVLLLVVCSFAETNQQVTVTDTTYVSNPVVLNFSPSVTCYSRQHFTNCIGDVGGSTVIGQTLYEVVRLEIDGIPYIYASIKALGKAGYIAPGSYVAVRTKNGLKFPGCKLARPCLNNPTGKMV